MFTAAVDDLLCGHSMVNGFIFKQINTNYYYIKEKTKCAALCIKIRKAQNEDWTSIMAGSLNSCLSDLITTVNTYRLFSVFNKMFFQFAGIAHQHLTSCSLVLQTSSFDSKILLFTQADKLKSNKLYWRMFIEGNVLG